MTGHKRIFGQLAEGNQRWAGQAAALLVGAYTETGPTGAPLRHAQYDLGQAVAHLTVQATALGLHLHQMAGFDPDGLHAEFGLPAPVRPHVVVAIGRLGDPGSLPDDLRQRESGPRQRRPLAELLLG